MNPNRRSLALATAAMLAGLATGPAVAQDKWPSKSITYIVPFPAGGTTDVLARLIAQKLGPALGTTIIIDNKGGAGGSVGSEIAARAAPDGYTLLGSDMTIDQISAFQKEEVAKWAQVIKSANSKLV